MIVLVTGASGFIAAQIVADLLKQGHEVICCVRNVSYTKLLFPTTHVIPCDFTKDTHTATWLSRLQGVDVVINCVGIFSHPNDQVMWAVHYKTPKALFDACLESGVKKIIQLSALGIDKVQVSYATSKKAADDYLLTLPITAVVVRPSFVYAKGTYGGSSLFRGLAGTPFFTVLPGKGAQPFQPICLDDLSRAVAQLVTKPLEQSITLDAVSQKVVDLKHIILSIRTWLGFVKTKCLHVPLTLIRLVASIGDWIPYSTLNSTSYTLLEAGSVSTPSKTKEFADYVGFTPLPFDTGVNTQPSTVQDHWHARLFFLKLPLRLSIAFVWLWTAISCLFFYPKNQSFALLASVDISPPMQVVLFYGSVLLDGLIGLAVLFNKWYKTIGMLQLITIVFYTVIITFKLPYLWIDPFMPIAKNIPLLMAILIGLAMESDK